MRSRSDLWRRARAFRPSTGAEAGKLCQKVAHFAYDVRGRVQTGPQSRLAPAPRRDFFGRE